jgi:hypothetical protein
VTRPDGSPDVAAAIVAARLAGIDGVLVGQVVAYAVHDDLRQDNHLEVANSAAKNDSASAAITSDSKLTLTREGTVTLAFKLIDARSGEIRVARQASHFFQGRMVNGQGQLPSRERVLADLLQQCARDIVALLAPHEEEVKAVLAGEWYIGPGMADLRRGNEAAVEGKWKEASAAWQSALDANPRNQPARVNLAIAARARRDYAAARSHLAPLIIAGGQQHEAAVQRLHTEEGDLRRALAQAAARQPELARLPPVAEASPPVRTAIAPGLEGPATGLPR